MAFEEVVATKEEITRFGLGKLWDKYNKEYCMIESDESRFKMHCTVDRDKDIWFCYLGDERVWDSEYDNYVGTGELRYVFIYNNKQRIVRLYDPKEDGFYDKENDFLYIVWELVSIEPEIKDSDEYKKVVEIIKEFLIFDGSSYKDPSRYTTSFRF